ERLFRSQYFIQSLSIDARDALASGARVEVLGASVLLRDPLTLLVVPEGSIAYKLGFRAGDTIVALDGVPLTSLHAFRARLEELSCQRAVVRIGRGNEKIGTSWIITVPMLKEPDPRLPIMPLGEPPLPEPPRPKGNAGYAVGGRKRRDGNLAIRRIAAQLALGPPLNPCTKVRLRG